MNQKILSSIKDNIRLNHSIWINNEYSNCYMYALNIDMDITKLDTDGYFRIGELCGLADNPKYSFDEIIYKDADELDIDLKEVASDYNLKDDEWKIALFLGKNPDGHTEFHFCKQNPGEGWSHKNGWYQKIRYTDCLGELIDDPVYAYMVSRHCTLTTYFDYISTYRLKLK